MISLKEAAKRLGMSIDTLRRRIKNMKRQRAGLPVSGPCIEFHQDSPRGHYRFDPKWIDDYKRRYHFTETSNPRPTRRTPNTPTETNLQAVFKQG